MHYKKEKLSDRMAPSKGWKKKAISDYGNVSYFHASCVSLSSEEMVLAPQSPPRLACRQGSVGMSFPFCITQRNIVSVDRAKQLHPATVQTLLLQPEQTQTILSQF